MLCGQWTYKKQTVRQSHMSTTCRPWPPVVGIISHGGTRRETLIIHSDPWPLEAVISLAVEADNMLWHHAPIELGAPKELHDPTIMTVDDNDAVAGAWRKLARENADSILKSAQWDAYADRFVSALITAGYPEDRPALYHCFK